jgi:alpha-galactosidase
VVAVVAVTFAAGAVFFVMATGGRRSNTPVSAGTIPAGPGVPSPVTSARIDGSASGRPASAAADVGASATSPSGVPFTEASGAGDGSVPGGGPTPQTSVLPTSAPPPTPTGGAGSCKAAYSLAGSWAGGYQASVTVADGGSSPLNGWAVELTLANGQSITNLWGGVDSGDSGAITVRNASYNGTVTSGGTATFAFTANGNGSVAPTSIGCVGR